jgi:ABC-type nitrate/sulfonate/bicarbonate transport system ATPase subunit
LVAVKDVNVQVQPGEFVCILGHSGCGKSTVLSIVAGLDEATYGGVIIDGAEVRGPGTDRAVFQSPCLLPWLTARENVELAACRAEARKKRSSSEGGRGAAAMPADHCLKLVGVAGAGAPQPAARSRGAPPCVPRARAR